MYMPTYIQKGKHTNQPAAATTTRTSFYWWWQVFFNPVWPHPPLSHPHTNTHTHTQKHH